MECATCQRELEDGDNVLKMEEAIVGTQGIVSLSEPYVFCSLECAKEFGDGPDLLQGKRRIP